LGYINPPDLLLTQLNLYTEEKSGDEEDMHERTRHLLREKRGISERPRSESEVALQDLVLLAKQHDNLYPVMVDILKHYGQIIQRDIGMYVSFLHWRH
jgi:diaphanous 1